MSEKPIGTLAIKITPSVHNCDAIVAKLSDAMRLFGYRLATRVTSENYGGEELTFKPGVKSENTQARRIMR